MRIDMILERIPHPLFLGTDGLSLPKYKNACR